MTCLTQEPQLHEFSNMKQNQDGARPKRFIVHLLCCCTLLSFQLPIATSFAPAVVRFKAVHSFHYHSSIRFASRKDDNEDEEDILDAVILPVGMEETLTEEDLERLTVPQLKQQLRLRGLLSDF